MSDWILADEEPQPDGIVGGDGATDSISLRFHHVTEPALVTVYLYAVDLEERGYDPEDLDGEPFDVEEMIEFRVLTERDNPDAAEVWVDYDYDRPSIRFFPTVLDAEDYRDKIAAAWLDMGASHYLTWNGEPVW